MSKSSGRILRDALASRGEFFKVILLGSVLALGINLITSSVDGALDQFSRTTDDRNYIIPLTLGTIGFICVVLSITLLGLDVFGRRKSVKSIEAVLLFDGNNEPLEIRGYDFSEAVSTTFRAIFQENPAFKSLWDKDPPQFRFPNSEDKTSGVQNGGRRPSINPNPSEKNEYSYVYITRADYKPENAARAEPKSFVLARELLEFIVLEELSLHLSDHFNKLSDEKRDKLIKEYTRNDIPELLLQNRVLALLSSPLEDRVPFSEMKPVSEEHGEVVSVMRSDGAIFSRFDLSLPIGSSISRAKSNSLRINSKRITLEIKIAYQGFGATVPMDFLYFYVGVDEPRDIQAHIVSISIESTITRGALLLPGGWELYNWVDTFLDKLEDKFSFEHFMTRIDWASISAGLFVDRNLRSRVRKSTDAPKHAILSTSDDQTSVEGKKNGVGSAVESTNDIFYENFDEPNLNPNKWTMTEYSNDAMVSNGALHVKSPGNSTSFPYIISQGKIIPEQGNFSIKIGFQYTKVTGNGTGIVVASTAPHKRIPLNETPQYKYTFRVWQDSQGLYLGEKIIGNNDYDYHIVDFRWLENRAEIHLDEQIIQFYPIANTPRPAILWLGNQVYLNHKSEWTTFRVDFIMITTLS